LKRSLKITTVINCCSNEANALLRRDGVCAGGYYNCNVGTVALDLGSAFSV
jgi:hypothetical protein